MTTKLRQPFASSSSADAPTRTLAAETNPSPRRVGPDGGAVKGTATQLPVEADRRPAVPLQHLSPIQAAVHRAECDFEDGLDWRVTIADLLCVGATPLELAIYNKAYFNCFLRSIGREDSILDLSAGLPEGEVN